MNKTRWKCLAGALTGLLLAACDSEPSQLPAREQPRASEGRTQASLAAELIPNRYIVVIKQPSGAPRSALSAADVQQLSMSVALQYGAQVRRTYAHALHGFTAELDAQRVEALRKDPRVAFVEQDAVVHLSAHQASPTWGLDRIDQTNLPLNSLYSYGMTGVGVNAYIIDTGIHRSHSEFQGRALTGFDAVTPGDVAEDCNGHGTHVAGTLGGSTYGVAKGVTLHAVRVLDCGGLGTNEGLIAGIDWVTAHHIKPAVANMSVGGEASEAVDQAVRNSISAGVTYVLAAGNGLTDACTRSPARTAEALTVGATDSADVRAAFSNYGTCVDLFAPGVNITSAWSSGESVTHTISGTSMASPHVAGVAALYLQAHPLASPATVNTALTGFATPGRVGSPGTGSPNLLLFSGFIQPGGDLTPPQVQITTPLEGTTRYLTVQMNASATDDVAVKRVEFWVNGLLRGSDESAPYEFYWDSVGTGDGPATLVAKAYDSSFNSASSAPVSFTVQNPGYARYDATLKAPACITVGAVCDTGALIEGRGLMWPERNAPNTLASSCADGANGVYHVDESLDRLSIATADGGPFVPGKGVNITATVWAWPGYSYDQLDLYHAADATKPVWTYLGTVPPTHAGAQMLFSSFTLPAGSLQAIRGVFRYGGSAAPCGAGDYIDHDDLVFAVDNPPTASVLTPAPGAVVNGTVNITASATDEQGVDRVLFYVGSKYITYDRVPPYSVNFSSLNLANGDYLVTVRAYDSAGNVTVSQGVPITIQN